ncbi:MAG: branched-chain amino acid ABC transporter permease [Dehalococcoidia bacterium]|nr:branched-chain amino acid ABC transporter permease [Dehalococcoidia bacterium]
MDTLILQLISSLVSASILFLFASGLTLVFGVTRILNIAHGTFYMLAGFLAFTLTQLVAGSPFTYWVALAIAPLLVAALGGLVELLLLRRIYGKDVLLQVLLTVALIFVFGDVIRFIWGLTQKNVPFPVQLTGPVSVGGIVFPVYYTLVMGMAVAIGITMWYALYRTRWGTLLRAATQDREMTSALGVDERRLFTVVFTISCWLAGMAGVLAAPTITIGLGMDMTAVIDGFAVIVVGGLGSLPGAVFSAVLMGLVKGFGILVVPQFALVFVFAIMAVVLILRPYGLMGKPEN